MDDYLCVTDNAKYYGTEDIQNRLLELLSSFHQICLKNGILYSLNSGTLLGAIRHNGFIPWDDDADIMMQRQEFEHFMNIDLSTYGKGIIRHRWVNRFVALDSNNQAFIDIFVVDNVPDNLYKQKIKILLLRILQGMMKEKTSLCDYSFPYNIFIWVTHNLGKFLSDNKKYEMYQKISKIGNKRKTVHVGIYNNLYKSIPRLYEADMMNQIEEHKFEDISLYITARYDRYLSDVYGDYMTPPSVENRKAGNYKMKCNDQMIEVNNSEH